MKIAVPTMGEKKLEEIVAEHFGRCPTYTILDETGNVIEIIQNTSSHMGGTKLPPELLQQNGINILLCQNIGPRAIEMCKEFQIDVYVDLSPTVKEIFNKWKNKKIKKATIDDCCEEHHS
jgi:predicted Fe-Mo cluster-binding NifX family protein